MGTIDTNMKIETLRSLKNCVDRKRAVICPASRAFNRPVPAAIVINMQGIMLLRLFDDGLYVYKK